MSSRSILLRTALSSTATRVLLLTGICSLLLVGCTGAASSPPPTSSSSTQSASQVARMSLHVTTSLIHLRGDGPSAFAATGNRLWLASAAAGHGWLYTASEPSPIFVECATLQLTPLALAADQGDVWVLAQNASGDIRTSVLYQFDGHCHRVRTVPIPDASAIAIDASSLWVVLTGPSRSTGLARVDRATGALSSPHLVLPPAFDGRSSATSVAPFVLDVALRTPDGTLNLYQCDMRRATANPAVNMGVGPGLLTSSGGTAYIAASIGAPGITAIPSGTSSSIAVHMSQVQSLATALGRWWAVGYSGDPNVLTVMMGRMQVEGEARVPVDGKHGGTPFAVANDAGFWVVDGTTLAFVTVAQP